ncbi:MAG: hypothetical protein ACM3XS_05885, partial [Bacteroidota bacterium]
VSFRLVHHEYEILFTPGSGSHLDAVTAVFGRDITREMMAVEADENAEIVVRGFVGKPCIARTSRQYELSYLNGRFIRHRTIGAAIERAFHSLLPIARYPFAVLFLTVDPALVDVNVHPAKLEARFPDEAALFRAVYGAVHRTLSGASLVHALPGGPEAPVPLAAVLDSTPAPPPAAAKGTVGALPLVQARPRGRGQLVALGVALNALYLLARDEEGLLVVDQHAAHERVLYDRYSSVCEKELAPQRLLLPATINLSTQQARALAERLPVFTDLGFGLEPFGQNTFLLRALPAALSRMDGARLVMDLLDELLDQPAAKDAKTIRELFLASMACHAAVKAGDPLSVPEMQALLDDLAATALPFTCPHGRPTAFRLTWEEIARRFKRR